MGVVKSGATVYFSEYSGSAMAIVYVKVSGFVNTGSTVTYGGIKYLYVRMPLSVLS